MTYRERREAKADRLRDWAEKREDKADAIRRADEPLRREIGFVAAQPGIGRLPIVRRVNARQVKEFEHRQKSNDMMGRAGGILEQLDHAIYSDDPDAITRVRERLTELEATRERMKAENAAYRKAHAAELKTLSVYMRSEAMPHPGWEIANLGGNITRQRERIKELEFLAARAEKVEEAGGVLVQAPSYTDPAYRLVTFAGYPGRGMVDALKAAGWYYSGGSWSGSVTRLPEACPAGVDAATWDTLRGVQS